MPGPHGNALLGQQVGKVGVVHALDHKTHQCQLRRAQQANAGALLQAFNQQRVQRSFVGVDGVLVEAAQVAQGRAQANHAGNRRGAGFKAQRGRAEGGVLVVGVLDHLAAKLPVLEAGQCAMAAKQHAQPVRAVQFVAGKHIEVAAQRIHVLTAVDHALGAIDHGQGVLCFSQCKQFR